MKARLEKEDFAKALKTASLAVAKGASVAESYTSYKIDVEESGRCCISAGSQNMAIRVFVECRSDSSFTFVVNAQIFLNAIQRIFAQEITIEKGKTIVVRGGNAVLNLPCISCDQFTMMPSAEEGNELDIPLPLVADGIGRCAHALCPEAAHNAIMESYYISCKDDHFTVVALDGKRVSFRGDYDNVAFNSGYLLPGAQMKKIASYISECRIFADGDVISFVGENIIIDVAQTYGTFFNCEAFVAEYQRMSKCVDVDREELLQAISIMTVFASEPDNLPVKLDISSDKIDISAQQSSGAASVSVPITTTGIDKDETVKIAFNAKYLDDALKSIDEEIVCLKLRNGMSPMYIGGEQFLELVLPVRIQQ